MLWVCVVGAGAFYQSVFRGSVDVSFFIALLLRPYLYDHHVLLSFVMARCPDFFLHVIF